MAQLFSDEWINKLKDAWNADEEVSGKLAEIKFCSIITCGYKEDKKPLCVFVVENGQAISAGLYNGEKADWDMRGTKENWMKWVKKPLGMTGMGIAFSTGKLKFVEGDFKQMIKTPSMAVPFVKSFALMTTLGTTE